ncbi:hypothetical protein JCGZ_10604 [Jatropha curcas]|uniref:Uncharacterized protein n=1 Tax=Jatropha curcas TaxID=180498 RepID=A0A067KVI5_JATCU|nr:hypothetical protein JCGZ_10604 [Jatropha curcas]
MARALGLSDDDGGEIDDLESADLVANPAAAAAIIESLRGVCVLLKRSEVAEMANEN